MAYRVIKPFSENPTLCTTINGQTVALNAPFEDVRPASANGPEKKRQIRLATQAELKAMFEAGVNIIEQYEEKQPAKQSEKEG